MPYQTNIPNAGQSPGLFPSQGADNFTRLKTIVGANHKFNDSPAADDGYHQLIKILPTVVGSIPNDPSVGQSFVNSADATNQFWFKDALNRLFQITPTIPIYAAVNFVGNAGSPCAVRFGHNIASVIRNSEGVYTINFTVNMPSTNYVVTGMGFRVNSGGALVEIFPDATYGNSIKVNSVKIRCINTDSPPNPRDLQAVFLVVAGG